MFDKKLKKRLEYLEAFLGLVYSTDEYGNNDYSYKVAPWGNGVNLQGELGEMKQDLVKRQEEAKKLTK